jgi:hypothetical protein
MALRQGTEGEPWNSIENIQFYFKSTNTNKLGFFPSEAGIQLNEYIIAVW